MNSSSSSSFVDESLLSDESSSLSSSSQGDNVLYVILALLSPIACSFTNIVDKTAVSGRVKHTPSYLMMIGVVDMIVALIIAACCDWSPEALADTKPMDFVYPILAATCWAASIYCYYVGMLLADASIIVGVEYLYPLLVVILSAIFLAERIKPIGYLGCVLLVLGAVTLSLNLVGIICMKCKKTRSDQEANKERRLVLGSNYGPFQNSLIPAGMAASITNAGSTEEARRAFSAILGWRGAFVMPIMEKPKTKKVNDVYVDMEAGCAPGVSCWFPCATWCSNCTKVVGTKSEAKKKNKDKKKDDTEEKSTEDGGEEGKKKKIDSRKSLQSNRNVRVRRASTAAVNATVNRPAPEYDTAVAEKKKEGEEEKEEAEVSKTTSSAVLAEEAKDEKVEKKKDDHHHHHSSSHHHHSSHGHHHSSSHRHHSSSHHHHHSSSRHHRHHEKESDLKKQQLDSDSEDDDEDDDDDNEDEEKLDDNAVSLDEVHHDEKRKKEEDDDDDDDDDDDESDEDEDEDDDDDDDDEDDEDEDDEDDEDEEDEDEEDEDREEEEDEDGKKKKSKKSKKGDDEENNCITRVIAFCQRHKDSKALLMVSLLPLVVALALSEFLSKVATANLNTFNVCSINFFVFGFLMFSIAFVPAFKGFKYFMGEVKRNWLFCIMSDVLTLTGQFLLIFAMSGMSASVVSSLAAIQPFCTLCLERVFGIASDSFKECLSYKLVPIILIVAGVVILSITAV